MVADEVVNHFQLVEELFFVEGVPSEVKPDQEFFYTPHVPSWLFRFFVVYSFALATILTITPNALREANTMGIKVIFPATAAVITALPATTWQIKIFSLVAVVQLFLAVMFFVIMGVKVFQHVPRPFGQGFVDVVEVENASR